MNSRFWAVALTGMGAVMVIGLKPILLTVYMTVMTLSTEQAGYVTATEMFGAMLGTIIVAFFVRKMNRRTIAFTGLFMVCASNLLCLFLPSYAPLLALRFLTGLGAGLASGIMAATIAGMAAPDRVFGGFTVMTLLLSAGGFLLSPWLMDIAGAQGIFLLIATMTLPGLLCNAWFPRTAPASVKQSIYPSSSPGLLTPSTFAAVGGVILFYLAVGGFWPFVNQLGLERGLSAATVSSILAGSQVWGALGALIPLLLGILWGRAIPIACALLLMAGCLLSLALLSPGSTFVYAFAVQAYMAAWLVFFPYMMGVMAELDPKGRLASLNYTLQNFGFTAGPALAGLLISSGGYNTLLWIGMICHLLCLVLMGPVAWKIDNLSRRASRSTQNEHTTALKQNHDLT